ncbi:WW domain-binding protein 2-like [Elgaria multicarinata webbii]|uniref:WW domain-binding protein 2-like n=1 Tax=Elgaria multicarinata webbii TaxID=159646 RepID=UPI002FCD0EED
MPLLRGYLQQQHKVVTNPNKLVNHGSISESQSALRYLQLSKEREYEPDRYRFFLLVVKLNYETSTDLHVTEVFFLRCIALRTGDFFARLPPNIPRFPTVLSQAWVLAHYGQVSLLLEGRTDFPEELRGTKKGMLYLTQYKMIFQHKDKGSTIIRFPLQLLGDYVLEEEPSSKSQHIKGTLTSIQGVLAFKFTFQYGASDCLNTIKDLAEAGTLREGTNLQEYPTASIYTYAHPAAPRTARSLNMLPLWPPPYPGPPDLPPPYSEVEATSPRGSRGSAAEMQQGCCYCRGQRFQNPVNSQD